MTATNFHHIVAGSDRAGSHRHRIGAASNISIVTAIVNTIGLEVTCGVAELGVQLAHIDSVGICYAIAEVVNHSRTAAAVAEVDVALVGVAVGHRQRVQIADLADNVLQLRQIVNAGMKMYQMAG